MNVWKYTSARAASFLVEIRQEACVIGLPVWPNTAAERKQQLKGGSQNAAENIPQKVAAWS